MKLFAYIKSHSVVAAAIAIVAVLGAIIAGRVASRDGGDAVVANTERRVSLFDASSFRAGTSTVAADGVVESVAQVDLKSQISGPLSVVGVSVGDRVYAGQTIVRLEGADLAAQLESARASLSLAEGQYSTGGFSLSSSKKSAIDAIKSAYVAVDESIRGQIDQFLFNTAGGEAPLVSYTSDRQILDRLHTNRIELDKRLSTWKTSIDSLSATDSTDAAVRAALSESKDVLAVASTLAADASSILNQASENSDATVLSTIEKRKGVVTAARASITQAISQITAADAALVNILSSHGSSAEAQVQIAAAGVRNLEAQIAKTVIRSPIAGTVAALPLRVGEYASPGALIATIVGGGGLEVKAYVSAEDLSRVKKGAVATLAGRVSGVVSSIAPSLGEANKKAEVRILIDSPEESGLVVGQSVPVSIAADRPTDRLSLSYRLPIQNVKIVPGGAYVYTIDADSKIVGNPVVLGTVESDYIEVVSGLTDDMKIVAPVYELEVGEAVSAQ